VVLKSSVQFLYDNEKIKPASLLKRSLLETFYNFIKNYFKEFVIQSLIQSVLTGKQAYVYIIFGVVFLVII
jgi:hypothetical protein